MNEIKKHEIIQKICLFIVFLNNDKPQIYFVTFSPFWGKSLRVIIVIIYAATIT